MGRITIFDVLTGAVIFACGVGAVMLVRPEGALPAAGVFVAGCAVPILLGAGALRFAAYREPLPLCNNGRCRAADYRIEKEAEEGRYLRCACGDLYLLTKDERLDIIDADGKRRPFRRRYVPRGAWRPAIELLDLEKFKSTRE